MASETQHMVISEVKTQVTKAPTGNFKKPEFPGGEEELYKFIRTNLTYPAGGLALNLKDVRVIVRGKVNLKGQYEIMNASSLAGTAKTDGENVFTKEAIRVVKLLPVFKPATKNDTAVSANYLITLAFPYNTEASKIDSLRFFTRTYFSSNIPYYSTVGNPYFSKPTNPTAAIPLSEVTEPEFPGGKAEMYRYLKKNIKFPAEALAKGDFGFVQHVVRINKDGSVYVMQRTSPTVFEKEVLRVLKEMPAWKPGFYKGNPISTSYNFSVKFNNTSPSRRNGFSTRNYGDGKNPEFYADRIEIDGYTPVKASKTNSAVTKQNPENGKLPLYPGGKEALKKFLSGNIQYPPNALLQKITGQAIIQANIDEDGRIGNFKTIHADHELFEQEALRVLKELPRWEAGFKNGNPASYQYLFPFVFGMESNRNLPILKLPANKNQFIIQDATNIVGYNNVISGRTVVQSSTTPAAKVKPATLKDNSQVYTLAEEPAVFEGGQTGLATFLKKNIKYPPQMLRAGVQGLVLAQFIVSATGKIGEPAIVKSLHPDADAEALRVIKSMPAFVPARQNGKPVAFQYTLPVRFGLASSNTTAIYAADPNSAEKIYATVDKEAYFPGSEKNESALYKFINDSVKNSEIARKSGVKGMVMARFIVDKTGKLRDIRVVKGVNPTLDAEAVKIINQMPLFVPARKDGKPVNTYYSLGVRF